MGIFSPILGRIRGKVGGLVYSHNLGGDYIRSHNSPVQPNSIRQQFIRYYLALVSGQWYQLDAGQRSAWDSWAQDQPMYNAFGGQYRMTGHQAFVSLNSRLLDSGGAIIEEPPEFPMVLPEIGYIASHETETWPSASMQLSYDAIGAGDRLQVWQTIPGGPGKDPNFNQASLVRYSSAGQASPWTVTLKYQVLEDQWYNLYVAVMDPYGRTSPVQKVRVQAVEPTP